MSDVKEIWSTDTGILDLPENWRDFKVEELISVRDAWESERERLKNIKLLHSFVEQMNREWAIETGIIENLYEIERGVTRTLIEQGFQAGLLEIGTTNRPRDWVIQLLKDQQNALEGLFKFIKQERPLSTSYIKELHSALLRSQHTVEGADRNGNAIQIPLIRGDWKMQPNYPYKGGVTYRYCPPEQVASEMDLLISMHTQHVIDQVPPEIESAWLHHRFSQIHPFQDGNGRVARTLASLVFIQNGLFPLVVTRDDKIAYLDALEKADDQQLMQLVHLFAKLQRVRFRMAVSISESTKSTNVAEAIQNLQDSVSKIVAEKNPDFELVKDIAERLAMRVENRLDGIRLELQDALVTIEPSSRVYSEASQSKTDHYFQAQINEIAHDHFNYYPNLTAYKRWVRLTFKWTRRAQLVFTFHAIGHEFSGVLVCAPFLEFQYDEDEMGTPLTLINVAEEPFEFFYNETIANIEKRFDVWLETVITVAIAELTNNL